MNTMKIQGLPVKEYAALWGSTDEKRGYFYNYSAGIDLDAEFYEGFISAILREMGQIRKTPDYYDAEDMHDLGQLLDYVFVEYRTLFSDGGSEVQMTC